MAVRTVRRSDRSVDPRPLLGALLRVPWEAIRERMLAGLHERRFTDLTTAHLNVLQCLGWSRTRLMGGRFKIELWLRVVS